MKKLSILALTAAIIFACNNQSKDQNVAEEGKTSTTDKSQNPDYQKGVQLIANSDCLTCHDVNEAKQGPTYMQVAEKYKSAPDTIVNYLANKIIKGGAGVWGETLMTPHPMISEEDAKTMARYVLMLNK